MAETENLGLKKGILDAAADITLFDENWDIIDEEVSAAKKTAENAGDMKAKIYDTDGDGVVDDASKLGGQLPEYYATAADLTRVSQRTDALEADFESAANIDVVATVNVNNWTENDDGGYSQVVSVNSIKSSDIPVADVALGSDVDANKLYLKAWERISHITTANGSITIYAYENKPDTAFNVRLKVVR